ncbi:MAG: peptidoglycan editing factor PgeF [Actinomycetota bacterium]
MSLELEDRGFLVAFTERTGGLSPAPFSSLNLGAETGDDPDLVGENRRRLGEALGIQGIVSARQVHGTRLEPVERATGSGPRNEADGLTTRARGVPLAVMVGDCVPLALASGPEQALATVHIGWRGLAAGIVQKAVGSFSEPSRIMASIGPSIGPCHYEVGREVLDSVREGTQGLAVVVESRSRPRLDLARTVEAALRRCGVAHIDRADECTACEPTRFFSHRRDGRTGRQALVAMRL